MVDLYKDEATLQLPNYDNKTLQECKDLYCKWLKTFDFTKKVEKFYNNVKHGGVSITINMIRKWTLLAAASGLIKKSYMIDQKRKKK